MCSIIVEISVLLLRGLSPVAFLAGPGLMIMRLSGSNCYQQHARLRHTA